MVRIAPVKLTFNPRTLWFDAGELDLHVGDDVVVATARGAEFATVSSAVFEADEAQLAELKTPLKPVQRLASGDDRARNDELAAKALDAMPVFRQLAAEMAPDMNPVAVEYLFDGDKAVFYFESEERIDFRDLVRKLASEFHVRVDMKQIGVRDAARMIGGLGHCGQELCCRRLGGDFNPVSIRMAKEQDLSLNPTKISGVCGRLMCCLRYEFEAYKDFHGRAPKKNAKIETPDGEGKVVDLDVPREIVSIKVGEEKPVKVPLADMEPAADGGRPNAVGEEAWAEANEPATIMIDSAFGLFASKLSGEDKLAEPGKVRHVHKGPESEQASGRSSRRRRRRGASAEAEAAKQEPETTRKPRRRRSTTVSVEGDAVTEKRAMKQASRQQRAEEAGAQQGQRGSGDSAKPASRRRSRGRSGAKAQEGQAQQPEQKRNVQVGRNSSGLRANRQQQAGEQDRQQEGRRQSQGNRRRRRPRKAQPEDQGE